MSLYLGLLLGLIKRVARGPPRPAVREPGRRPGRPRLDAEVRELIVRLVRENPRGGAIRVVGELRALGFQASPPDGARISRPRPTPTAIAIVAYTPPQSCPADLGSRSVHRADDHDARALRGRLHFLRPETDRARQRDAVPTAAWLWRQLIEATPFGRQPRFLIRDRDRSFGGDWPVKTRRLGIQAVLTPVRAPNANAVAERVIGTIRHECPHHMIVLNERHLHAVLDEFVRHYNRCRPHRALELDSPDGR